MLAIHFCLKSFSLVSLELVLVGFGNLWKDILVVLEVAEGKPLLHFGTQQVFPILKQFGILHI